MQITVHNKRGVRVDGTACEHPVPTVQNIRSIVASQQRSVRHCVGAVAIVGNIGTVLRVGQRMRNMHVKDITTFIESVAVRVLCLNRETSNLSSNCVKQPGTRRVGRLVGCKARVHVDRERRALVGTSQTTVDMGATTQN